MLEIIPRALPLEERAIEDLTAEEARELLRRTRVRPHLLNVIYLLTQENRIEPSCRTSNLKTVPPQIGREEHQQR